ncbi:Oligopeptide transporter [Penicillium cinerascens]|uniref:Oligopeptide transporter n=1 Tax=Penicillium cinerascens TaxID=70096 RepID=A0A9W9ME28_9EURO|nr:Oligopeptide transporter [Penicillium cinerascens]KAJ5198563.1 Oligopeptide transporter [Penicillium cinerascens]
MSEVVGIGDRLPTDTRPTQQSPCTNEKAPETTGSNETSSQDEDLPHVADRIPVSVWLVILISTLERFAFFGIREPFHECMVNQRDDPLRPGALGLGQSKASNLSYMFSFLLYTALASAGNGDILATLQV